MKILAQTAMRPAKNREKVTLILAGKTITHVHAIFGIMFRIGTGYKIGYEAGWGASKILG